jgi:hypothetical protein
MIFIHLDGKAAVSISTSVDVCQAVKSVCLELPYSFSELDGF